MTNMDVRFSDAQLEAMRAHWAALEARQLDDGSVAAVMRLLTTTAIILGCTTWGWERRFCFATESQARAAFALLKSEDDEPTGWIARRPEQPCDIEAKGARGYIGGDPALPSSWINRA